MDMQDRTRRILEKSIQDFIQRGRPITSGHLYDSYDFGIKPAMLRIELSDLDEAGYLKQIHPSGGRFPTNKAYKFFVNKLLQEKGLESQVSEKTKKSLMRDLTQGDARDFVYELSQYLNLLSVFYEPNDKLFYAGLSELFEQIEAEHKTELQKIVEDFETLQRRIAEQESWWEDEKQWPKVFVGSSPITTSDNLSVIAGRIQDTKKRGLLITIGPRRMDYKRSLGVFTFLNK